jgi:hypothetical protein
LIDLATKQNAPAPAVQPQRSERPKPGGVRVDDEVPAGRSPISAPRVPAAGGNNRAQAPQRPARPQVDDEDDFGDTDVNDLLG